MAYSAVFDGRNSSLAIMGSNNIILFSRLLSPDAIGPHMSHFVMRPKWCQIRKYDISGYLPKHSKTFGEKIEDINKDIIFDLVSQ